LEQNQKEKEKEKNKAWKGQGSSGTLVVTIYVCSSRISANFLVIPNIGFMQSQRTTKLKLYLTQGQERNK